MTDAITLIKEGKARLAELEKVAGQNYRSSKKAFDTFILTLHQIREERAWHYAVDHDEVMLGDYLDPQFKRHYLVLFCQKHGISVASVYEHLGTVDTWEALGRPKEELAEPNVGVAAAKGIKEITHYDRRKGELILPSEEVISRLPGDEGDDPVTRINKKIKEVFAGDEPPQPATVRNSFAVDVGGRPEIAYWQSNEKDVWVTFSHGDEHYDRKIIPAKLFKALEGELLANIKRRLGIQLYE